MWDRGRSDSEAVASFPSLPLQAIAEGSLGFVMGWGEDGSLEGKGASLKESHELLLCGTGAVSGSLCACQGGVVGSLLVPSIHLSHSPLEDFAALGQVRLCSCLVG